MDAFKRRFLLSFCFTLVILMTVFGILSVTVSSNNAFGESEPSIIEAVSMQKETTLQGLNKVKRALSVVCPGEMMLIELYAASVELIAQAADSF